MSAMAELTSQLSIVPHMRFSRSTFLRNTEPRSRGAPFFARPRECNAAHKALPVSALKSAAAHNEAKLASGGGHGTQSNEVRARLLDGPCGGCDHPGDQTVGGARHS